MDFKIRAQRGGFSFDLDRINLFAWEEKQRTRFVAQPLSLKEYKEGDLTEPFIKLHRHEAQQLMDDLWDCGLRPSEGSGSAGSLKATQGHLKDMRKIVFKELKIKDET
jgi:hypothetical protein